MRESRFFSYRASLLLATGSLEAATKDIERALKLSPSRRATHSSLQTIIAVVGNKADKAVEAARKAVAADPKSATAQIALSYARQAAVRPGGRPGEPGDRGRSSTPDDALAWARLAEIRSSLG